MIGLFDELPLIICSIVFSLTLFCALMFSTFSLVNPYPLWPFWPPTLALVLHLELYKLAPDFLGLIISVEEGLLELELFLLELFLYLSLSSSSFSICLSFSLLDLINSLIVLLREEISFLKFSVNFLISFLCSDFNFSFSSSKESNL